MTRLQGTSRAIRDVFPDAYAPAYEAVTSVGDTVTVLFVVSFVYWAGRRRRSVAVTMGYSFAALSLVLGLKAAFGLPRPPASAWLVETDGMGFPSGHATAATVVYAGLAHAHGWWDDLERAVPVGVLVVAVGFSRVVLGVHYLADVLAGFALGLAVILGGTRLSDGEPRRAFAAAVVCASGAVAVAGTGGYAPVALGGALGGLLATARFDVVPDDSSRRELVVTTGVGLLAVLPTVGGLVADVGSFAAMGVAGAVTVAGVVLAPAVAPRLLDVVRVLPERR